MPQPPSLIVRARFAAFVAFFCSVMAAGPGTLIVPVAVRLAGSVVCAGNESIEHRRVRYGYPGLGEWRPEVSCVDRASGASRGAMFPALATLFGIYFAVLFIVVLLGAGSGSRRAARRRMRLPA